MSECTDLSFSQVACLALGLPQTAQHRLYALNKLQELNLVPIHVTSANPLLPSLVSKTVQEIDPFVYIKYADDNNQSESPSSSSPSVVSSTVISDENLASSYSFSEIFSKQYKATNSPRQIEDWINSCNAWGGRIAIKLDGKYTEGRWLWVLLDKHLAINVTEDLARYEQHCRHHPMTTIDYARKSKGKERTNN